MTKILNVTATPSTFTSGNFPIGVFNNGPAWQFTFTPSVSSTALADGFYALLATNDNGGLWLVRSGGSVRVQLFDSTAGSLIGQSNVITYSASQAITCRVGLAAGTNASSITISGATTGDGSLSFTTAGPYFTASTLGVGTYTSNNTFNFAGTISSVDDTVPDDSWLPVLAPGSLRRVASSALMAAAIVAPILVTSTPAPSLSWQPSYPVHQLPRARAAPNVGGLFAPTTVIPNAPAPPMSWEPEYPDRARAPRRVVNFGGTFAPVATIPNAPAPPLSWEPEYPSSARRARTVVNAGGLTAPTMVIPNVLPPGLGWMPSFPDQCLPRRRGQGPSMFAPPFAGGRRLTVGAAAIRQNVLSALPFSTPLTTFGTDLTFTADPSTDTLTTGTHGMVVCAGPFQLRTTGTLPAGADDTTLYYMICPSSTTVKLALTPALAKAGTAVNLTDAGTGTHTLVRVANTAPLHSTLLAIFARGNQAASPNQATDSAGNTYNYVSGFPRAYDAFTQSAFSVSTAFRARGGDAHTWSASIGNVGGNQDEVVIGGLEIFDAQILQSSSVVERADGSGATITSGTVTTTAKALLVAIIAGNGNVNQQHVFTFLDGFTKVARICAEGDVNAAGYIQIEVAIRLVDIAGTYSFRAQGTSSEGGQMALLAFQAVSSDLQPFDWLMPQAEIPVRPRRGQTAGETRVELVNAPAPPPLSWEPEYPSSARRARSLAIGGETSPPSDPNAGPLTWSPEFPDSTARARVGQPAGEIEPPSDTNAGPLTWAPRFVDSTARARRGQLGGEVAPPPDTNAGPITWAPEFVDSTARAHRGQLGGEVAPLSVSSPAPVLWLPVMPEVTRAPSSLVLDLEVAPLLVIQNPPAPALSWAPTFPDRTYRARRVVIVGGMAAPVQLLPNLTPPPTWPPAPRNEFEELVTEIDDVIIKHLG